MAPSAFSAPAPAFAVEGVRRRQRRDDDDDDDDDDDQRDETPRRGGIERADVGGGPPCARPGAPALRDAEDRPAPPSRVALRATLASLDGVLLRPLRRPGAGGGGGPVVATAWAAFGASSSPSSSASPKRMSVASSQYSSLFADGDGEGGMMAIESLPATAAAPRGGVGGGFGRRLEALRWEEGGAGPHLELRLDDEAEEGGEGDEGAIEIRICVACSAAEGGSGFADGTARLDLASEDATNGRTRGDSGGSLLTLPIRTAEHPCYGDALGAGLVALAEDATLRVLVERVRVPSRPRRGEEQRDYAETSWKGGRCAPASVIHRPGDRANEAACPVEEGGESGGVGQMFKRAVSTLTLMTGATWTATGARGGKANGNGTGAAAGRGGGTARRRDPLVGKVVEATDNSVYKSGDWGAPPRSRDLGSSYHPSTRPSANDLRDPDDDPDPPASIDPKREAKDEDAPDAERAEEAPPREAPSSRVSSLKSGLKAASSRFFCGADLGLGASTYDPLGAVGGAVGGCGEGLGDALKLAAAAGHHCDEDHVGLYVMDTEAGSLGTSIDTDDVA